MARELDFNRALTDMLKDLSYTWRQNAIVLGGTSGSGGGYGSPVGGFIGQLPQSQVCGDVDELRVLSSGSANSLLWNLNRMRYWLTNQISASAPSPTFPGQVWINGTSGSTLNIRNETDSGWITFSGGGGGGVDLDPSSPQDVGSSAVIGSSGSASHGNHVHRGVSSVSSSGGAYAYGNIQLIPGSNTTISQSSGSFTINSTASGGTVLDASTPLDVAGTAVVGTSGSASHGDHVHRGVGAIYAPSNNFAYGNITLTSGTGIAITQSSGSFTFSTTGSGGGGASTSDHYIVGQNGENDTDLTNRVVIPYLSASADIRGAAGAGIDDEFDGSSLTNYTWLFSTPPSVSNENSTIKSHWYIETSAGGSLWATRSWSSVPSSGTGAYDARCKVSIGYKDAANSLSFYLAALDSNTSAITGWTVALDVGVTVRTFTVRARSANLSSFTTQGSAWTIAHNSLYLRLTRDGSNNCSAWFSMDGLIWQLINTFSLTYTVAQLGIGFVVTNGNPAYGAIDWMRTDT
jgi:hypothetical protein